MALYLHLGPSGSGKTYNLYNRIFKEASADIGRDFLIVVPEQYTLATQREVIRLHPEHGIMNIDVLSFMRLAHRVFEELGVREPVILEDTGKTMIVKKVAMDVKDKLGIYAGKVTRQGFIEEMKSVIAEFYQYGIGTAELERMLEAAEGHTRLTAKLKDIKLIFDGFRDFINGRFIMNEEIMELLCERGPEAKVLKGACVCFDGFTGFTVMQLEVIRMLLKCASDVHITLTMDRREEGLPPKEESLFGLSRRTIDKLERMAEELDVRVVREWENSAHTRFDNTPALAALEHNIFRYPYRKSADFDGITLLSGESPAAELLYCIGEIERLVAEENYKYGEIAIVTGDEELYRRTADREFKAAGIPLFRDTKRSIVGSGPVEMLRAAIEIAETDYSYDAVFRLLKTGMTPLEPVKIAELENYCLARGIRGRRMWEREFEGGYRTAYKLDMESINESRQRVAELLDGTVTALKQPRATVTARVEGLKLLLAKAGTKELLERLAAKEREKDDADYEGRLAAKENEQLFGTITEVFERITLLLGDDVMPLKEFREILDTGFKEAKLALVPQGEDSVLLGDIVRTRLNHVRAVFFLGVNDGIIPRLGADGGILSDADRTVLMERDIELSPTRRQNIYLNEFYIYLNLTKPTDRLYVSYHRMTADKKPGRAAYIVGKMTSVFEGLEIRNIFADSREMLIGSDRGVHSAAAAMREKLPEKLSVEERTVIGRLISADRRTFEKIAEGAFRVRVPETISGKSAEGLYNKILEGSVTMLEQYASCAFSHYIRYGLKLEERPEYRLGSIELGNIYHKALELYCQKLKEQELSWHETDENIRRDLERNAVEGALAEYEGILKDSKRNEYIRTRIERVLSRTVEILDAQVKAGSFEPEYFETGFMHAAGFMALKGKIDRMDISRKNGKLYLRVIDYKSGTKDFDLVRLFYGLQIQLAMYMNEGRKVVAERLGTTPEPIGMYYYNIDDPFVETDAEDAERALSQALRLKGPTLQVNDGIVASDAMFEGEEGELAKGVSSSVIAVGTTKAGEYSKNSRLLSENRLKAIGDYIDECVRNTGTAIMGGKVEVNPYELGGSNPCKYCPYLGICGFDRRLGDSYRLLKKESEDDIWEKLTGAGNSGT